MAVVKVDNLYEHYRVPDAGSATILAAGVIRLLFRRRVEGRGTP